jgi:hypothetical protein
MKLLMKLFYQTIFSNQLSFTEKVAHEVVFLKNSFASEAELCQRRPYYSTLLDKRTEWLPHRPSLVDA